MLFTKQFHECTPPSHATPCTQSALTRTDTRTEQTGGNSRFRGCVVNTSTDITNPRSYHNTEDIHTHTFICRKVVSLNLAQCTWPFGGNKRAVQKERFHNTRSLRTQTCACYLCISCNKRCSIHYTTPVLWKVSTKSTRFLPPSCEINATTLRKMVSTTTGWFL